MSQHISLSYDPVQGSIAGCFTARLLSHRKMLLLHFRLTMNRPWRNKVSLHTTTFYFKYFCDIGPKSGPLTQYNFYFKYFCGMQNIQWVENKFLTPYSAPNNRTASESFLCLIKLFIKLTPSDHKNG
jgi:hypothetical protein